MNSKYHIKRCFCALFLIFIFNQSILAAEGVSEEQMQKMMEQMEKIQACFAKIDQSAMDDFAAKTEKLNQEIQALCAAGKRDQAQEKAIAFGKDISETPEMQEMIKCTKMAGQSMDQMKLAIPEQQDGDHHVCDER